MRSPVVQNQALNLQVWFLTVLACYAVLELSFNHRLLELAGDLQLTTTPDQLHDIELWGRVVSGLGLALLLMRWLDRFVKSRIVLLLLCCTVGLTTMWHLQKALVDAIVARADQQDLMMSWRSQLSTQEALNGRILLRGEILLGSPAPADIRPVMSALWASSVAGLSPDDLDSNSGAAQLISGFFAPQIPPEQLSAAYRKTVMTPVVLGASLLFGLLNLCQFFAGCVALVLTLTRHDGLLQRCKSWLLPSLTVLCMGLSWWPGNVWTTSPAYQLVASPALWADKPYLAPFVEWSVRAEPAWADSVAWVHSALLQDFEFKVPFRAFFKTDTLP
ncbi:hypothetical protein [Limnohabitans sp.]|jgi:hypothetical protein|uniref:hypothetical protein n=1 Tax=Limnohabitans sp. TaxID=1907725 RepID=UPI0037C14E77